jgi:hypothetical protein
MPLKTAAFFMPESRGIGERYTDCKPVISILNFARSFLRRAFVLLFNNALVYLSISV